MNSTPNTSATPPALQDHASKPPAAANESPSHPPPSATMPHHPPFPPLVGLPHDAIDSLRAQPRSTHGYGVNSPSFIPPAHYSGDPNQHQHHSSAPDATTRNLFSSPPSNSSNPGSFPAHQHVSSPSVQIEQSK